MKIKGKVSTIIFKNDTNGWTVILLKQEDGYITAVGETDGLEIDDEIELNGEFTSHKVYGEQFKFDSYIKVMPHTNLALIEYIANNISGVGKKTAQKIVDTFGDETIDIIRFYPSKLEGIKGLNSEKIFNMSNFFNEEWDKWNVIEYLTSFSISVVKATKIYKMLGTDTIDIIKENPYSLLNFVNTLDFKLVDDIGKKQNIPLTHEARLEAGILYCLTKTIQFGNTCIEYERLVENAVIVLQVENEEIENAIAKLVIKEKIYIDNIDDKDYVFTRSFYIAESNIAQNIVRHSLLKTSDKDYTSKIEKVSKKNNIELSSEQINAIKNALNSKISIITGGPGTGKTTIIKCIIDIIEGMNKEYVLCAPTGRAAKRITQTTNKEAKTLHRLLEITKVSDNDFDTFLDLEVKQINADYIIVDEASMLDVMMMNNLLKAILDNANIILVGDVNQLPSVGPGNILKDIIDSNIVTTTYLTHIYRQSQNSNIIMNAHRVNNGECPIFENNNTDCYFLSTASLEDTEEKITSLISYRLENYISFDKLKDLQIITPMKKTKLGTIELNKTLQEILNPKSSNKKEKEINSKLFRVGDKVMQIVNNYDKTSTVDGIGIDGVYNGDIGYITSIDFESEELYVKFDDDKIVSYSFDEADELEHAYAITVHKSQGSEFDYVVLPIFVAYKKLFTRNLLYTAITRAKKMLIIIGNKKVIEYMVNNVDEKNRKTGLKKKLQSLI